MAKCNPKLTDTEFNCILAISSDAFDIHEFLTDFIKGEIMNYEQYLYLYNTASHLLECVRTYGTLPGNRYKQTQARYLSHN